VAFGALAAATIVIVTPGLSGAIAHNHVTPPRTARITTSYMLGDDGGSVVIAKKTWTMSVDYSADGSKNQLGIVLTRVVSSPSLGAEQHTWDFPISTTSALTHSGSKWTLNTATKDAPVAKVDVVFAQTASKRVTCGTGSETIYTGTLTGTVTLNTELAAAKTLTVSKWTVKGTTPSITVDSSCVPKPSGACLTSASFLSGTSPLALGGSVPEGGATLHGVAVVATVPVTQLKGTTRYDEALRTGVVISYNSLKHSVSVSTTTAGVVTGSGTAIGGKITSTTSSCTSGGKRHTETVVNASSASFSSPAGKQFVGHMTLTPNVSVPASSKSALWTDNSFK
jgi:hypothetical protein